MNKKLLFLIIVLSFCLSACDHGIAPPDINKPKTGISGTIYYSNWAAADTVYLLKVVFFKNFPPDSIVSEILSGEAVTYPPELTTGLPLDEDSTQYEMELDAGTINYISVAQQFGPDVFSDWRSVGQFDLTPADSLPSSVTVIQDSMQQNIDIYVDFNTLPIQPF